MVLFSILLLNFVRWFKVLWNQFLDKVKFTSVKLCIAKNWNANTERYTQPCTTYTHDKYCPLHKKQMFGACEAYHCTRGIKSSDPLFPIMAKKELEKRSEYCDRFSILSSDFGHMKWTEYLQGIIDHHEEMIKIREEDTQMRKEAILNRVLDYPIILQDLNNCKLSLDSTKKYADDDSDWSDDSLDFNQDKSVRQNQNL